ncbi:MAG: serine/threonine protein kinase [Rhodocyclaceae bacterium]|nr:serine/threonine protein kinase [Rhodocyclaceae bacterium]
MSVTDSDQNSKIGRFEIRRILGRGAQSVVYLAWDPQLQREVAIKTLRFSKADPQMNQMLLAEARTVSKLRHPNIVPIFDAGEDAGYPYLVFELVEGRNLAELIKAEGKLSRAQAADLMRQVLDAVAEAHAQGIIHRDLKPSNILIDAKGLPRVMDFGIASLVGENSITEGQQNLMGTPAYMAPEYVADRQVSDKLDVFAAGLILLEMITGKKVMEGDTLTRVLYKVAHEPVTLPADAGIDEKLASILLRALSRDPAMRPGAALMKTSLEEYLGGASSAAGDAESAEAKKQSTLDFLLRRMRHKTDFPALSDSVSAINKLTNSDRESITKLSNTILKDYALTNKILRLVNSAYYRQAGGGGISTVSRAVIVLGFDTIRNIAITVLLFEHLQNKANARELKEAFLRANLAGLLARDASQKFMAKDMEEAFICSMFHGLGQLLGQFYFPEEIEEIRRLMQQKRISEQMASTQVLGLSFEDMGMGIARIWGFPATIVGSMRRLPEGQIKKPATHEEQLRVISGFSNELCDAIASSAPEERGKVMKAISSRFIASVPFSEPQLKSVMERSFQELEQVANILHVNLKQSQFARQVKVWTGEQEIEVAVASGKVGGASGAMSSLSETVLGDTTMLDGFPEEEGGLATPTPEQAENVLTAGIQDISNSLVDDFALNDILRIILETMYRAMGFEHVILCLKDGKSGQMLGRFGFGADCAELAKKFRFPLSYAPDVFHLATSKAVDILISDIDDPKIAERVPKWFRDNVPAKTFVLFPLTIKSNPVALIYCDRIKAGSIVIPERELTLLKTLRNQALLAIKQST